MKSNNKTTGPAETLPALVLFLDSAKMGGIESHCLNLAMAISHNYPQLPLKLIFWQAYQPEPQQSHPLWQALSRAGIPVECARGSMRRLYRQIPSGALVHSHGYKANLINKTLSLTGRWRALPTHHNGDPGEGLIRRYVQLDEYSSRWFEPLSVSAEIYQRLGRRGLQIANFVPLPDTAASVSACNASGHNLSAHNSSQQGQVAFVGRISPEKNPAAFCQLSRLLEDELKNRQQKLHLYGGGEGLEQLEASYPQVECHGQCRMEDHWPDIGLLCITSDYEGLPLAALEAMSRGIPVCSFAVGDLPALIEHGVNGWLIPPGDLQAMTLVIRNWWLQPPSGKDAISRAARDTITEKYSIDAVLPVIMQHYQRQLAH